MSRIRGIAAVIILPKGKIYTVEETTNRPEYGKLAGMRTIPMETLQEGESGEESPKIFSLGKGSSKDSEEVQIL